jgi:hypothetical protein
MDRSSICSHLPADVHLLLLALVLLPHPPFLRLHQLQLLDAELLACAYADVSDDRLNDELADRKRKGKTNRRIYEHEIWDLYVGMW